MALILNSRRDRAGPPAPRWSSAPCLDGLRGYQREGVLWLRAAPRRLLADEMRLGKTAQVLRALEPPAIVLCPAAAKHVWADECARWRPDLRPSVSEPGELRLPIGPGAVAISTYASLPVPEERARGEWLVPWDLRAVTLVLDEAHCVSNPSAQRTARARILAGQCGRVWSLTGTPLAGLPRDLWGVLETTGLARQAFGSFERFAKLFGGRLRVLPPRIERREVTVGGATVEIAAHVSVERGVAACRCGGREALPPDGAEAALVRFSGEHERHGGARQRRFWEWPEEAEPSPEIQDILSRVALRRLRRDVWADLPPKIRQTVRCDVKPELAAELDRVGWPEGAELPPLTEFSGVRARVAEARLPALLERIEAFERTWERSVPAGERKPVVVFSAHRAPIDVLGQRGGWGKITGDQGASERALMVSLFQQSMISGLAVTIGAGGVAVNLSRASHGIFVDRSFTPADNLQAEDRLVAGDKREPVHIETLVSDHPLELRVQAVLDQKQARIEASVRA